MRPRASRALLMGASALFALFGAACIDLFHSTDFETLCTASPMDPQCVVDAEAGPDTMMAAPDADASRAHPDFCSWDREGVYEQAGHACALLGACVGPLANTDSLGSSSFGACMFSAELAFNCNANKLLRPAGAADEFWSCISTATTCDEATQCVFPGGGESCVAVSGGGSFTACGTQGSNATTQLKCAASNTPVAATPCVMNGQTCMREDPSTGACVGEKGYSCEMTGCDGTNANDCAGSRDKGVDCAQMSATCAMDSSNVPGCSPTSSATACSDLPAAACNGAMVSACIGGKQVTIDCSLLGDDETGLGCDVTTAPPTYAIANACMAPSGGCTSATDSCVSTTLSACVRGEAVIYDCSKLAGYTSCIEDADNGPHCSK